MKNYTPLPWKLSADNEVVDSNNFEIATVASIGVLSDWHERPEKYGHWAHGGEGVTYHTRTDEEEIANAELIVKAVNAYPTLLEVNAALLEALKEVVKFGNEIKYLANEHLQYPPNLVKAIDNATEAIAKAETTINND
jgi:hypothetical protein